MRRFLALGILLTLVNISFTQDKKIDKLEILYDQGYYAKVLRKTNKLLANPEYDYSGLPSFYKSLALFRLAEDPYWYKRHQNSIDDAIEAYDDFLENESADDYIHAHFYEIASLKTYLKKLGTDFKGLGLNGTAEKIDQFVGNQLEGIKSKPDHLPSVENIDVVELSSKRNDIIVYGKSFIGVKYVWAGSDESGFDCSGFTSFVLKKFGYSIPRTASGQMEEAKKKKIANAEKGDLVFFGNGNKITHVGLVISEKGEELIMVHASTSKGVIITNVEQSTYWKPKLKGVGTYL